MNPDKIGSFISELRKEKGLTQQELANILHVTDRAISHWENGRRIPDITLFKPICDTFNISITELMSGEKITKEHFKTKSEENMMKTLKEHKLNKRKLLMIIIVLCISTIALIINAIISYKNLYPKIDIFYIDINREDDPPYHLYKVDNYNNKNIYYYGLISSSLCSNKDVCFSFLDALKHKQTTLEELQEFLEKTSYRDSEKNSIMRMYDGGTTIYNRNGYMVIYCNTIEGNKDIYIGDETMLENLNGGYCGHKRNPDESFTRTYTIISSSINKKDNEFNDITLKNNKGEQATVLINNSYILVPGHTYEFTFNVFDKFEDNISNIFKYGVLLKAKETDKQPYEYINEDIIVNEDLDNGAELNEADHVRMDIIDDTLTNTGCKIRITDYSNNLYIYGGDYYIEKKENGKWNKLELLQDHNIDLMAYHPDYNGHLEFTLNWEIIYGKLPKGYYRIVKSLLKETEPCTEEECHGYHISVEFNLD